MRIGIFAIFTALLMGCADSGQKCGNKVLALWPTEAGDYKFQEITLSTLNDPYSLSGGAAKIYFEALIGGGGFSGKVARPRFTRAGDLCVPMDSASAMAVSMYARFEHLLKFEASLGTLDMLQWPRKVGLDIHVRSNDGMTHNNAHYFGQGDSIAVLPYNLQGVPLGLNPGVMAHEHFHGHFQKQVIDPINLRLRPAFDAESLFYSGFHSAFAKATVEDLDRVDTRSARGLNSFVLRAWNEGLADFYGGIYSKNPRYFKDSLPTLENARALDARVREFMSAKSLQMIAARSVGPQPLVSNSYDQGAVLARVLFTLANSGVETPEAFLVRIMRRLNQIPEAITGQFELRVLEFGDVLPVLLRDFPLAAPQCAVLVRALSKELLTKNFPQCSNTSVRR